jgi:DNA polymerase theta
MIRVHSVITNRTREVDSTDEVTRNFSEIGGKCHLILQVF